MSAHRNIQIGLGLIAASYAELLLPDDWVAAHHFAAGFPLSFAVAFFSFGIVFLGEGITKKFGGTSLLSLARGGVWRVVRFVVVAALTGLALEVLAQWLGKLWYYAYYPHWFYWPALVPSFILYWVLIAESYLAVKAVLDHYIRRGGNEGTDQFRYHDFEPYLYGFLSVVGSGMFLFGVVRAGMWYRLNGGFVFNPYTATAAGPPLHYILYACFGVWLLAEAALYMWLRPSLIRSVLHGYFNPLLALLAAALLVGTVWESQNAMVGYWVYTRWPSPESTLFGVQVSVLATWPSHYLAYLAFPAALVPSWAQVFFARGKKAADMVPGKRHKEGASNE